MFKNLDHPFPHRSREALKDQMRIRFTDCAPAGVRKIVPEQNIVERE